MEHTPEPWRAEWQPGQTPKHTYTHCVMYGDDSLCDTLTKADAERIVACVNACTGMADPAGEIQALRARSATLESQLAAEREAVRVLGEYVYWNDTDNAAKHLTSGSKLDAVNKRIDKTGRAMYANPIARAAVEKAGGNQ